jgi:hypothetical protein
MSYGHVRVYDPTTGDVDLTAAGAIGTAVGGRPCDALFVPSGAVVSYLTDGGDTVTHAFPAAFPLPVRASKLLQAGSAATSVVALWF